MIATIPMTTFTPAINEKNQKNPIQNLFINKDFKLKDYIRNLDDGSTNSYKITHLATIIDCCSLRLDPTYKDRRLVHESILSSNIHKLRCSQRDYDNLNKGVPCGGMVWVISFLLLAFCLPIGTPLGLGIAIGVSGALWVGTILIGDLRDRFLFKKEQKNLEFEIKKDLSLLSHQCDTLAQNKDKLIEDFKNAVQRTKDLPDWKFHREFWQECLAFLENLE